MVNPTINKRNSRNNSRNQIQEVDPDSGILDKPVEILPLIGKFARLKYGDNKELLFNVNCQVQILMDYFRLKCKDIIGNKQTIDLVDKEGNLKNIRDEKRKLASDFLQPRETYILVEVKQADSCKGNHRVELLLQKSDLLKENFLKKITDFNNQPQVSSTTTKPTISIVNSNQRNRVNFANKSSTRYDETTESGATLNPRNFKRKSIQ